ncbi:MAG: SpoIVB peptidase S55 domain-containing protein [Planctomycetota bacterium]
MIKKRLLPVALIFIVGLMAHWAAASPPEMIKVSEVKPGMKGYGLTVFEGTKIEKFDVEVISILKNHMGPKTDIVLLRANHKVTDHANIIHGMSGSPIYLEGKLAGALSLGFTAFPKDPLFGMTPIEYMLKESERPMEEESYLPLPAKDSILRPVMTPLFFSGFHPNVISAVKKDFEEMGFAPIQGSGSGSYSDLDIKLEPGAAVGVELARGDFNIGGVGTVTYVDGDKVLVFGHSMGMFGQISIPMATAYVHTVIAGSETSFKLASMVKPVGTFTQDRLPCVAGYLGKQPVMIPVKITTTNQQTKYQNTYKVELINQKSLLPLLLLQCVIRSIVYGETIEQSDATVKLDLVFKLKDGETILLDNLYSTQDGYKDLLMSLASQIVQLLNNPFKKMEIAETTVDVSILHKRKVASIQSVWLNKTEVKAGETVTVNVLLKPFGQSSVKKEVDIKIPENVMAGEYEITVVSGREATAKLPKPETFEDMISFIKRRYASNLIITQLNLPSVGIAFKGKEMPHLPTSVFGTLISNTATGVSIEQDSLKTQSESEWVIDGSKNVTIKIKD